MDQTPDRSAMWPIVVVKKAPRRPHTQRGRLEQGRVGCHPGTPTFGYPDFDYTSNMFFVSEYVL